MSGATVAAILAAGWLPTGPTPRNDTTARCTSVTYVTLDAAGNLAGIMPGEKTCRLAVTPARRRGLHRPPERQTAAPEGRPLSVYL